MRTFQTLWVAWFCFAGCGDDSLATRADAGDVGDSGNAARDATSVGGDADDLGDASTDAPVDVPPMDAGPRFIGGERPAAFAVPRDYDAATPTPLLIVLHGYGASGALQELYFNARTRASEHGMLLVFPDGTENVDGARFWNAPDTCCDPIGESPDDVSYIVALIDEMDEHFNVDRGRVYLLGHSNGAFMSYRMACDAPEAITAIVSLAGATTFDEEDCTPSLATSVLQIHGTMDDTIPFEGGAIFGQPFPGALESVRRHALIAGCEESAPGDSIDLAFPEGSATQVSRYEGCDKGLGAELWTVEGGGHLPGLQPDASDRILTWLEQWSR